MKAFHVILAVAGAAAAGLAVGLLTAPRKGAETRDDIIDFIKSHCPGIKENKLQEIADQIAEELK